MLAFLVIGGLGVALLLVSVLVGDHLDGALDSLGAGDWLSGGALAGFVGAFGFAGAIALSLTNSFVAAVVVGLLAGAAVGVLVGFVTVRLQRGGDEATVRSGALVGLPGTVINDIPAEGYGEVSVVIAGHLTKLNARCAEPLSSGHGVIVEAVLSPTSVSVVPRYV